MAAVDGSLHLGALAIVLTIGYIGLDHQIRRPVSDLEPILLEIKASLQKTLNFHFGMSTIDIRTASDKFMFDKYTTYLACLLSRQECLSPFFHKLVYFVRRQVDIPLFFYFVNRIDIIVIGILCSLCFISFIYESAAELWVIPFAEYPQIAKAIFLLYTGTVIWVLITIILLLRLGRIKEVSDRCSKRLEDTFNAITTIAQQGVRAQLDKAEQESGMPIASK